MKKFLLSILFLLVASAASAQTGVTSILLTWDPNPASEGVITYSVNYDGIEQNSQAISCTSVQCQIVIGQVTSGLHNCQVFAANTWGTSPPSGITFTVALPTPPANLRVQKLPQGASTGSNPANAPRSNAPVKSANPPLITIIPNRGVDTPTNKPPTPPTIKK